MVSLAWWSVTYFSPAPEYTCSLTTVLTVIDRQAKVYKQLLGLCIEEFEDYKSVVDVVSIFVFTI